MENGKPGAATTRICVARPDGVEVRGRDLCRDLMGSLSFTEYFYLLMTGSKPTDDQRYFLDLLLVAIAEHGMTPTVQAARMTLAADPDSLQAALAAGILGCGSVLLGTSEASGRLLGQVQERVAGGERPEAAALSVVRDLRNAGRKIPGFGHPLHRPVDPRTVRILELATARGIGGAHVGLARNIDDAVAEVWGKRLVMNVSMPIAAVLMDLDFPAAMIKAIPLLARTGGILAHLAEEQQNPLGFVLAANAEAAVIYRRQDEGD